MHAVRRLGPSAIVALCLMPAPGMAQGTLCIGPPPGIRPTVTIPNLCPGKTAPVAVGGLADNGYTGSFTLSTTDCALGIKPSSIPVNGGKINGTVTATGPNFQRTANGYLCTIVVGSPSPATLRVGNCTYKVSTPFPFNVSYNMKKPGNCP